MERCRLIVVGKVHEGKCALSRRNTAGAAGPVSGFRAPRTCWPCRLHEFWVVDLGFLQFSSLVLAGVFVARLVVSLHFSPGSEFMLHVAGEESAEETKTFRKQAERFLRTLSKKALSFRFVWHWQAVRASSMPAR
ncbi:unnamed protein product [Effrenium voratum]|nr:unnamed protein product [Effrenium voratum]